MSELRIQVGSLQFRASLLHDLAPATCSAFEARLPFVSRIVHVRWSGEAVWMPLGDMQFGVGYENATSYPSPGQVILYPGGVSETEILISYGHTAFASKAGMLAGNHFLTVTDGLRELAALGRRTLWEGAQEIIFDRG